MIGFDQDDSYDLSRLRDRSESVWLVTGAAFGPGNAIARWALRDGHRLVATASHLDDLWPLVEQYGPAVVPIELDVNDESADLDTARRVIEIFGHLDVIVNNASYDSSPQVLARVGALDRVRANLFSTLWISEGMLAHPRISDGGHIVLVFGLSSTDRYLDHRGYDTSRRALEGFAERLARQVSSFAITVTILVPVDSYDAWFADARPRTYRLKAFDFTDGSS